MSTSNVCMGVFFSPIIVYSPNQTWLCLEKGYAYAVQYNKYIYATWMMYGCMHAWYSFIMSSLMLLSSTKGCSISVLSNGILSRGGMDRYSCLDVRNGANSTRACSWMSCEHFKCVHGGVFQPNHCLQPQLDMAVSRKRLRLCLRGILSIYMQPG